MHDFWVKTNDLPPAVVAALKSVGFARPNIRVVPEETVCTMGGCYGNGYQAFVTTVDLGTGRQGPVHWGSWGGANPFTPNTIDSDRREHPIPAGGIAITGQRGGGRPVSATLHVHPANVTPALTPPAAPGTPGAAVTAREAAILACFARLKGGAYRREQLEAGKVTAAELADLVARGLLKINRAGAGQITADGRNLAARDYPGRDWTAAGGGFWPAHLLPDAPVG